jgi:hypothetical protein
MTPWSSITRSTRQMPSRDRATHDESLAPGPMETPVAGNGVVLARCLLCRVLAPCGFPR